ncbi:MAG: HD domain-containing phosphohydrolase [Pseudomonadota bacterium]
MKLPQQPLCNSLRINVRDIRLGMFIAELDRPWTDTPFLIQGFLLDEATQLDTLRKFVAEVTIDPTRSTTDSLRHLPWDALHTVIDDVAPLLGGSLLFERVAPVEQPVSSPYQSDATTSHGSFMARCLAALKRLLRITPHQDDNAQPRQYYLHYAEEKRPGELTPPSTMQFSRYIQALYPRDTKLSIGLLEKIAFWFSNRRSTRSGSLWARRGAVPAPKPQKDRPDFLPANMPLVNYQDSASIEEETVRAREIMQQAEVVLEKIVDDIESDLPIDVQAVTPVVTVLVDSVVRNPAALMWSARMRDENKKTYLHGLKVAIYLMVLGRHLGFPKEQLSELGSIGLLLDIGMLKVPAELVEKTGELTPEEAVQLMQHVQYSIQALEQGEPLPRYVARGIQEHHERIDGSGYPSGLAGTDISVYGRMAAIADTFAAMTTARPYDVTHSAFDAMKELFKESATRLHGPLVEQFVQAICIFPVGSLIELASGEAAIVLEHNGVRRLAPKILVLTDPDKNMLTTPYILELMLQSSEDKKILRGLADGAYGIDYRDYYLG